MSAKTIQDDIAERMDQVREQISRAAQRSGRDPASVDLIVVTKAHPVEVVQAVIDAGGVHIGENYVEEAVEKMQNLREPSKATWHMIGHVQSRKARLVSDHFDILHSLDSLKLAQRLQRFSEQSQRTLPVLLEFNVSGEETKYGWPAWETERWPELLEEIDEVVNLSNLEVQGLMTMAPFLADPEQARPFFKRLRGLRDYLAKRFPAASWDGLSMGMSADYQVAVEEGATWVRVGQAIVGSRPANQ